MDLLGMLVRGEVLRATVGANRIVVHAPRLGDLTSVGQGRNPVLVQELVPELAVEALAERALDRLSGLGEVGTTPRS